MRDKKVGKGVLRGDGEGRGEDVYRRGDEETA